MRALAAAAALAAGALASPAAAHAPGEEEPAPELLYELPEAGSYGLPVISRVTDRLLLDSDGHSAELLGLAPGQCALVSFVYLTCGLESGCPLALATFQRTDRALAQRADLRERVRLVTVSFDPARDTPQRLGAQREALAPRADWRFLTARDAAQLAPVLAEFGQDASGVPGPDGRPSGLYRHVLKVFLVDAGGGIRNVYSSGFLDHRLLLRDVETLLRP